MQAMSGQMTAPALEALLRDGALAGAWVLDPRKSSVQLHNKSIGGLVRVNGVFREVGGSGTVSPDGEVGGTITVAAGSVDTGNARRDRHLRSADFFDTASHPDITFAVDGIRPSGQGAVVSGALTVCGRTRRLSFEAVASAEDGDGELGLDAEVQINRADYGLTWTMLGLTTMDNVITIHVVFTRQ
jgi:polyisoprenoid-binding protein YceI